MRNRVLFGALELTFARRLRHSWHALGVYLLLRPGELPVVGFDVDIEGSPETSRGLKFLMISFDEGGKKSI